MKTFFLAILIYLQLANAWTASSFMSTKRRQSTMMTRSRKFPTTPTPTTATTTTRIRVHSISEKATDTRISNSNYEYKDDCFGFMSFIGGAATQDVIFGGIFVALTLLAALATRLQWLPVDPKRCTIVDRKVPGVVAALTLGLTFLLSSSEAGAEVLSRFGDGGFLLQPDPSARRVQCLIGCFSMVTAFLDIRWRDRLDYPEEFRRE